MSALSLHDVTDGDAAGWNAQVARSPQGTVFCSTGFLHALPTPHRRLEVRDGKRTVALLPLIEDAARERVLAYAFTPYQGLLFLHDADVPTRQRVLDEYRITELVAAELATRYREVALRLSWLAQDLRPFLWHNYHDAGAPRYRAEPRFTAVLDLRGGSAEQDQAHARACRRQEARKAAGAAVSSTVPLDAFIALYSQTFARQEIELESGTLELVRSIAGAAVRDGWGWLAGCTTPAGLAAATLFVFDHHRAYYLFAANDPAQRNSGAATRLMFDNLDRARAMGLAEVDFVGVNSPARGDFKLSFNPELKLYFELHYQQAAA